MTKYIWKNYTDEKSEFTKNDFDAINDSNVNDILEEDHKKGIWNYVNKYHNKKVRDIDIREILSKIKHPWKNLIMNTNESIRANKNREIRITIPEIYTIGKIKKKLNLNRLPINQDPELIMKCGILLMTTEHKNLMSKIKKLLSVWCRDTILRYMHGDVAYRTKHYKTGYVESYQCEYCYEAETQEHKYIHCVANGSLNRLLDSIMPKCDSINKWLECKEITVNQLEDLAYFILNVEKFKRNKVDPFDYYNQRQLRNKKQKGMG